MRPILHRDGSVSYWSALQDRRVDRARAIPDRELWAMPAVDRERIENHTNGRGGRPKLPADDRRSCRVVVLMTRAELAALDAARGEASRSSYLLSLLEDT